MLFSIDFWTPSFAWNLISWLPIRVVLILPDLVRAGAPQPGRPKANESRSWNRSCPLQARLSWGDFDSSGNFRRRTSLLAPELRPKSLTLANSRAWQTLMMKMSLTWKSIMWCRTTCALQQYAHNDVKNVLWCESLDYSLYYLSINRVLGKDWSTWYT